MYSLKPKINRLKLTVVWAILCGVLAVIVYILALVALSRLESFVFFILFALAGLLVFMAYWAYRRPYAVRLNCPNCKKHIPAFDPWMCPGCDKVQDVPAHVEEYEATNKATNKEDEPFAKFVERLWKRPKAYGFLYPCSCLSKATAFKCHNCGEVIALTESANPDWFAYHPKRLPSGMLESADALPKSKGVDIEEFTRYFSSKYPEVRAVIEKVGGYIEFGDMKKDLEKVFQEKVEAGEMTQKEADADLRRLNLFIRSYRTVG